MPFDNLKENILLYYATQAEQKTRGYIGASLLGHACERRIWLDWKAGGTKPPTQNLAKTELLEQGKREEKFDRGRHEESRLIKALQGAGYFLVDRQLSFSAFEGNFKGHVDGIILDEAKNKYVLEIKSCQERYFKAASKNGVQKTWHTYYVQCQMYMHFFDIGKTLFLAVNKNNGEIYQEILNRDEEEIANNLLKITRIISHGDNIPATLVANDAPPPKMPCQYCEFVNFCYPEWEKNKEIYK